MAFKSWCWAVISCITIQTAGKKEEGYTFVSLCVVLLPDQWILQLLRGRKKQIVGLLNALFILLFMLSVFISRANLDNTGYRKGSYAEMSPSGKLENALWGSTSMTESHEFSKHEEVVLFQGDWVLATALQYAGRARQLYILLRGGVGYSSSRVSWSISCSGGWERKVASSMLTTNVSTAEGWGMGPHPFSAVYFHKTWKIPTQSDICFRMGGLWSFR